MRLTELCRIGGRGRDYLSRASVFFSVWVEIGAATPTRDTLPSSYSLTCAISFWSGVSTSWSWYEVLCDLAHFRNGKCNEECRVNGSFRGDRGSGSVRGDRGSGRARGDRGSGSVRGNRGSGRARGDRGAAVRHCCGHVIGSSVK